MSMESSFENQTNTLLESVNKSKNNQPLRSSAFIDPSMTSMFDPIINRINAIEERLNASDSIYRIAAQTNTVRDRERREQIKNLVQFAHNLTQKIEKIDKKLETIPKIIESTIKEEIQQKDQSQNLKELIDQTQSHFTQRFSQIENTLIESTKKNQKTIKKLKSQVQLIQTDQNEDTQVDDIRQEIIELKRHQDNIMSLLKTINATSEQDFNKVTTELNDLWSHLSKRD